MSNETGLLLIEFSIWIQVRFLAIGSADDAASDQVPNKNERQLRGKVTILALIMDMQAMKEYR